jgi:class 3 adenylate cyclase
VTASPDEADLERLGLYDPAAPDAVPHLQLLRRLFERGASVDEVVEASRTGQLGDLALDVAIRPPGETMTLERFVESSGLDADRVHRLWSAFGLPESGAVRVTPDIAGAIRFLDAMAGLFQLETSMAMARVMGSSSSRMAEALISAFRVDVELPNIASGSGPWNRIDETMTAGEELLPMFIEAVNAIFRRHMVLASYQMWLPDEARAAVTHERTVGFADLVSSTEAVRAASPAELAVMVREFEARVWELVTDAGGRVVKLIGDEAMFVVEAPAAACDVALRLVDASPSPVRVGLAFGTVVALSGDYYGETVNLAARLVDAAEPSTIVVSESVARRADDSFTFDLLPARDLKGFGEPVALYRVGRH